MHEYDITNNIVKIVLEEAKREKAEKIVKINIVIGELSSALPDCIEMYFEMIAKDTVAEGAKLVFQNIEAELICKKCNIVFPKNRRKMECPSCGEFGSLTGKGKECYIESMEIK